MEVTKSMKQESRHPFRGMGSSRIRRQGNQKEEMDRWKAPAWLNELVGK